MNQGGYCNKIKKYHNNKIRHNAINYIYIRVTHLLLKWSRLMNNKRFHLLLDRQFYLTQVVYKDIQSRNKVIRIIEEFASDTYHTTNAPMFSMKKTK